MLALEMRQVVKRYQAGIRGCSAGVDALRSVDLRVQAGEGVGIVGAPGAGKSTLLLCASGALRPDAGDISWFGQTASRRLPGFALGYVPDTPMHYPFLTVREVLEHHAHLRVLAPDETAVRIGETIETAGLVRWAEVRMAALPCDAARRVAIAQELVGGPRLLLIDEPFAGVGSAGQATIIDLIHRLARHGMSVLLATRDARAASSACNRVIVMSAGHLHGEVDPVRVHHASRVAEDLPS